jgi:hypothetical protein
MKFLKSPIVKTALVVLGVLVALNFARPYLTKVPLLKDL